VYLWALLAAAGFAAGVVNAMAGGGSLLSFPALLATGMPAVTANATSTLALWPGSLSSVWAYRGIIGEQRRRAWILAGPSLVGGLLGSILLLHTSERLFRTVVPWLILFACALLAAQDPISRFVARRTGGDGRGGLVAFALMQFLIAVYGGYFGAGIGILMLAGMAIFVPGSLQPANGLKVLMAMLINGMAAIYFFATHAAHLPSAAVMAVTSLLGGYVGARLAQKLPGRVLRYVVIAFGVAVAGKLFLE
jgi:hypothetical protein